MTFSTINISKIKPSLLVVMGVSGCGKSKLAKGLQQFLEWPFQEGDSLHPKANIEKMSSGIPLTDQDREPWLLKCHEWLKEREAKGNGSGILTCSSLKRKYRDILRGDIQQPVYFVYLDIPKDILVKRMKKREGHFMPVSLLDSQLQTLEPPQSDENCIRICSNEDPFEEVLQRTLLILQQTLETKN